jgi:hypothetical protein
MVQLRSDGRGPSPLSSGVRISFHILGPVRNCQASARGAARASPSSLGMAIAQGLGGVETGGVRPGSDSRASSLRADSGSSLNRVTWARAVSSANSTRAWRRKERVNRSMSSAVVAPPRRRRCQEVLEGPHPLSAAYGNLARRGAQDGAGLLPPKVEVSAATAGLNRMITTTTKAGHSDAARASMSFVRLRVVIPLWVLRPISRRRSRSTARAG